MTVIKQMVLSCACEKSTICKKGKGKPKRCNAPPKGAKMHFTENNIVCRSILLDHPKKVYHVSGTRTSFRDVSNIRDQLKTDWRSEYSGLYSYFTYIRQLLHKISLPFITTVRQAT